MFDTVIEMLSYPFMTRAFLVGSLVALCSALLGVSLVLKRYSMIGDGLSHVGFGAMAIAAAMNAAPLTVAIPVVIVAAILLLRISGNAKIKGDAAIALISTTSLAVGVMVISLTTGMNTDVYNYMFGSILAMSAEDVKLSLVLSVFVRELEFLDEIDDEVKSNQIFLDGYVCKEPIYRKTPLGREIADLLLAVNRPYGKSDYIPCICWGRNARYASAFAVGGHVLIWGRIQSREYMKRLSETEMEKRTAYEVSVSKLEYSEN